MLPSPSLDKAQRDALHGQILPYRGACFCPRKPPSPGQFFPWRVPTGMPSIGPGRGSRRMGSELEWVEGGAERC